MPDISPMFTLLLTKKKVFVRLFWLVMSGYLALLISSYFIQALQPFWLELGKKSGTISVIAFSLSLFPGIAKRFGVTDILQKIQIILMAYRRQFGIAMYLFALGHYFWVRFYIIIVNHLPLIPSTIYEFAGTIAFMLSLPLFLSSNDFSQKKLGRWWKMLHKLTYIIIWAIFAHLILLSRIETATIIMYCMTILELFSWVIYKIRSVVPASQNI